MSNSNGVENLRLFARSVTSQNGEDGIISYLLDRLGISDGWCCEFGAWDGIHFSNVCRLWRDMDFNAVLIESDGGKFGALKNNVTQHKSVLPIHANVSSNQNSLDSLDGILSRTFIPFNFDVLSIDIDGNDYEVWKSFMEYKPKIVIIEVNSNHMPDVEIINVLQDLRGDTWRCTSLKPMVALANEKGYELVAHISCNAIFVDRSLYHLVGLESNCIEDIYHYEMVRHR